MSQILVVGASGTVGAELSRLLKAKGEKVLRATSRKNPAVDQVHLDLLTKEGLGTALKGVEKLFLLAPPGHVNQHELLNPVIDQAKKEGVKKIVLMTAMGVNAAEGSPLRQVEHHVIQSGITYNVIRPNWFMQNFNTFWLQGILDAGKIFLPVAKAKGSFIDSRDISAVAAELLVTDRFDGQEFDLTGSDVLDHDEVAVLLSKATGKKIAYQEISPEQMREGLLGAGVPAPYAEFLLMILSFFKQGYSERTTDSVQKITGRAPIRFATYAEDFKKSW